MTALQTTQKEISVYPELAKKYLKKARSSCGSTQVYFANLCQVCLAKSGSKPEEIGSTTQELSLLISINKSDNETQEIKTEETMPKEIAKKYLKQCQDTQGTSRQYFANLSRAALAKHQLTPENIGTTEQELEGLQNKGFLEGASNYLELARTTNGFKQKCYADLCWDYLLKGRGKPSDIGTSEKELLQMMKSS